MALTFQGNPFASSTIETGQISSETPRSLESRGSLPPCQLEAFRIADRGWGEGWMLLPLPARRAWMDAQPYAYQCHPLVVANQWGWQILCPTEVRVTWDGTPLPSGIRVEVDKQYDGSIKSQFGEGIVTFGPPWLFRTPPGWNLMAKGPSNHWKPNASPLEGVIETWWLPYTFTLNWKILAPWDDHLRPGRAARPACFRSPTLLIRMRAWVEAPLSSEPKLEAQMNEWVAERGRRATERTTTHHLYRKADGVTEHLNKVPVPKLTRRESGKFMTLKSVGT